MPPTNSDAVRQDLRLYLRRPAGVQAGDHHDLRCNDLKVELISKRSKVDPTYVAKQVTSNDSVNGGIAAEMYFRPADCLKQVDCCGRTLAASQSNAASTSLTASFA